MTRSELIAELLGVWEESAQYLAQENMKLAESEVRTAIKVLGKTYTHDELFGGKVDYHAESRPRTTN